MSDNLGLNGEDSLKLVCPYDPAHCITKGDPKGHLETGRQVYIETLTAEGRQVELKICGVNPDHRIPAVEKEIHESLCQDSKPVSDELVEVVCSGQAEESVEGEQGQMNWEEEPVGQDVRDKWFAVHLEDFASLSCASSAAAAAEGEGAAGETVANWDKGWEEECAKYQDEEEESEDEDVTNGSGLSEKELEEIYAELAKKEAEADDKYSDSDDFAGYDPWTYLQDSE